MRASGPLLVVSALLREQAALRRRLGVGRGDRVRAGPGAWLAVTGDGAHRAEEGLARLVEDLRPARVLVIGLAGGLSPDVEAGELLVGERVLGGTFARPARALAPWPAAGARGATLVSASRIVARARDKARLWTRLGRPRPAAVDLESNAYVDIAERAGIALSILRVVSDARDEDLPAEISASTDAHGAVRPWAVALRAAARPRSWPHLARLERRASTAARRLASAVIDRLPPDGWG
jgi:nucleoside phosphorylase